MTLSNGRHLRHSRHFARSLLKALQVSLGARFATRMTLLLVTVAVQSAALVILCATLYHRNKSILKLRAQLEEDFQIAPNPPIEYNMPTHQEQLRQPNNDVSQSVSCGTSRISRMFAQIAQCQTQACDISHWAYLGEKCFYRPAHVKDRAGHNASLWSIIQDDIFFTLENDFPCPISVCRPHWPAELNLTKKTVLRAMQHHFFNASPWDLERLFKGTKYVRVTPFWGLEYTFNGHIAITKDQHHKSSSATVNGSVSVTIRRGFTNKYCDVSINSDILSRDTPVYIIVPYSGRIEQLRQFYKNFVNLVNAGICLRLIVATHGGVVQQLEAAEELREMQLGISEGPLWKGHFVQVVAARGDRRSGNFSRSVALLDGVKHAPQDALLFLCDVDMTIYTNFFQNCRFNTHRGFQVYYPVVYSLYPYGETISREHGYWRKGGYGMVCIYKSDFMKTWAWTTHRNQERFVGWGMEDVMLYIELSNHWRISIFSAVEPNLIHRWHTKFCEFNVNIAACVSTILQNLGSKQFLATIVAKSGIDVRKVPYSPIPVDFHEASNHSRKKPLSDNEGLQLPGHSTANVEWLHLKQLYDDYLRSDEGGLLSLFAKDQIRV